MIYLAKLGINIGYETDKLHPVLIFQGDDRYIRFSETVFAFPISSNAQKRKFRVLFSGKDIEHGNVYAGSILIQQGRTLSTFRLERKIGRMKKGKLFEAQRMFHKFLYKNTPLKIQESSGGKE